MVQVTMGQSLQIRGAKVDMDQSLVVHQDTPVRIFRRADGN